MEKGGGEDDEKDGKFHLDIETIKNIPQSPSNSDLSGSSRTSPYEVSSPKWEFAPRSKRTDSKVITIGSKDYDKISRSISFEEPKEQSRRLSKSKSFEVLPQFKIHTTNFGPRTSISEIIKYIVMTKLKLVTLDYTQYVNILEKNLIMNMEILCSQKSETIDKLGLPLALESELKIIITDKSKEKIIVEYNNISDDIKFKMLDILNTLVKNNYYRNVLFDDFYKKLFETDKKAKFLLEEKDIAFQSKKLFHSIGLLVKFINNTHDAIKDMDVVITKHMILGINLDDYNIYSKVLSDTISSVMDQQMDDKLRNSLYVTVKMVM